MGRERPPRRGRPVGRRGRNRAAPRRARRLPWEPPTARRPPSPPATSSAACTSAFRAASPATSATRRRFTIKSAPPTPRSIPGWPAWTPRTSRPWGPMAPCSIATSFRPTTWRPPTSKTPGLEFVAAGNAVLEGGGDQFTARAAHITYDQKKDLMILEGDGRTDAELYRQLAAGAAPPRPPPGKSSIGPRPSARTSTAPARWSSTRAPATGAATTARVCRCPARRAFPAAEGPTDETLRPSAADRHLPAALLVGHDGRPRTGPRAGALATGGTITAVVLHPLTISRTDVSINPRPLLVVWAGPLLGVLLPLGRGRDPPGMPLPLGLPAAILCGLLPDCQRRLHRRGILRRCRRRGRHAPARQPGVVPWLFGAATFPLGLYLWHGLGPNFGLGCRRRQGRPACRLGLVRAAGRDADRRVGVESAVNRGGPRAFPDREQDTLRIQRHLAPQPYRWYGYMRGLHEPNKYTMIRWKWKLSGLPFRRRNRLSETGHHPGLPSA